MGLDYEKPGTFESFIIIHHLYAGNETPFFLRNKSVWTLKLMILGLELSVWKPEVLGDAIQTQVILPSAWTDKGTCSNE